MDSVYKGDAETDGKKTKNWIVGHFIPPDDIRHSDDVEIKWGVHQKGEKRIGWVTGETRTTVALLISGKIVFEFRDKKIELSAQGDYLMWPVGTDHRWEVIEDSVVITVRWPSIPN